MLRRAAGEEKKRIRAVLSERSRGPEDHLRGPAYTCRAGSFTRATSYSHVPSLMQRHPPLTLIRERKLRQSLEFCALFI